MTALLGPWTFSAIYFALLCLCGLFGNMASRRLGESASGDDEIQTVHAGMIATMGLVLAFTFSMSLGRYQARRTVLVEEANAIGTAYLRAEILEPVDRIELRRDLRSYLDARLRLYGTEIAHHPSAADLATIQTLQGVFWSRAVRATAIGGRDPADAELLVALNEVIDDDAVRTEAAMDHVPATVWVVLSVLGAVNTFAGGYLSTQRQRRRGKRFDFATVLGVAFAAAVASLFALAMDLDRPGLGFVRLSQHSLIELRDSLRGRPD